MAWREQKVISALVLSDVTLALVVWVAAMAIQRIWGNGPISGTTIAGTVPCLVAWVGLRALLGLYPGYGLGAVEELRRQTYGVLAALAIAATFAFALQIGDLVSRLVVGVGLLGLLLFAPLSRQLTKWWLAKAGLWGKPVVILSSGEPGNRVAALLSKEWSLGYAPIAVLDAGRGGSPATERKFEQTPDEQSLAEATKLARQKEVDSVVIAMPHTRREQVAKLVNWASFSFRHVTVIPNLYGIANSAAVARDLAGVFGVEIRHNLLIPSFRRTKRVLDVVATVFGGIFVLPLILALCLIVWAESGGPIFYRAQRMGRDGATFACVKFRTMIPDAEETLLRVLERNPDMREEYLKYHKLRNDPRVTRVGRFLRRTSLDELPQLWNVLRGEMSLVGPRPYLPRESEKIGASQAEILRVYPGMTGPWQVSGRSSTSFDERVGMDAEYVRDWSVWLDTVLLARTVRTLVLERDAY